MPRILKDPLVHFLAIGAAIFALYAWRGHGDVAEPRERIVVSAAEVQSLAEAMTILNGGRRPSQAELAELIEPTIREEVLYREALALGLDRQDTDVRRRLVQKMTFLTRDLAEDVPAPDEETLAAFLADHEKEFAVPERISFKQRFYSSAERGERARKDALADLARLTRGESVRPADTSRLDERYVHASRAEVVAALGASAAEALFAMPLGEWQGPIETEDGFHLVRVSEHKEAHTPELAEVHDAVLDAYTSSRRKEAENAAYQKLRAKYDIVVEMPKAPSDATP